MIMKNQILNGKKDTFNNNGVIEDSSKSNNKLRCKMEKTMDNQNWTAGAGLWILLQMRIIQLKLILFCKTK